MTIVLAIIAGSYNADHMDPLGKNCTSSESSSLASRLPNPVLKPFMLESLLPKRVHVLLWDLPRIWASRIYPKQLTM